MNGNTIKKLVNLKRFIDNIKKDIHFLILKNITFYYLTKRHLITIIILQKALI